MNANIHPLRRWLFEQQQTLSEFGARAKISPGYLSDIVSGKKRPTLDVIDRITRATAGDITANDFQDSRAMELDPAS